MGRSLVTNQAAVEELQRQQQEVTMVATAVTEMASAAMEIAGNAENTAAAAQQSAQSSEQGKMLVNQTRHSINNLAEEVGQATGVIGELSRHAQAISGILSTIQGIAEQTNLLALNAAIGRPVPVNRVAASPWWRTRCGCCPRTQDSPGDPVHHRDAATDHGPRGEPDADQPGAGGQQRERRRCRRRRARRDHPGRLADFRHGGPDRHRRRGADPGDRRITQNTTAIRT